MIKLFILSILLFCFSCGATKAERDDPGTPDPEELFGAPVASVSKLTDQKPIKSETVKDGDDRTTEETVNTYNEDDRLTKSITMTYEYDEGSASPTSEMESVVKYTYTAKGRLSKIEETSAYVDVDGESTEYVHKFFYKEGLLEKIKSYTDRTLDEVDLFSYDDSGRLISKITEHPRATVFIREERTWDWSKLSYFLEEYSMDAESEEEFVSESSTTKYKYFQTYELDDQIVNGVLATSYESTEKDGEDTTSIATEITYTKKGDEYLMESESETTVESDSRVLSEEDSSFTSLQTFSLIGYSYRNGEYLVNLATTEAEYEEKDYLGETILTQNLTSEFNEFNLLESTEFTETDNSEDEPVTTVTDIVLTHSADGKNKTKKTTTVDDEVSSVITWKY